jgi:hypothetical protein
LRKLVSKLTGLHPHGIASLALDRLAERFRRAWRLSGVVTYPNLSSTMQIAGQILNGGGLTFRGWGGQGAITLTRPNAYYAARAEILG